MIKINCQKVITEFVDTETGEVFTEERILGEETKKEKKPRAAKKPKDEDTEPKVYLEDNKLRLNNKAVELTGYEPDMKIDVKFEKAGRLITPVMMSAETGNRLTKSYTISCRGSKRDNLIEYGDVFNVVPYEGKMSYFKLVGNKEQVDDIIDVPEEISDPESFDMDDFDLSL